MDISVIAVGQFSEVGRLAVMQELNTRLLANKTKEIEEAAFEYNLHKVEEAVIAHFKVKQLLSDDEEKLLKASRKIRNKILHCEFDTAMDLVCEFTGKTPKVPVEMVKFEPGTPGAELLELIQDESKRKDVDTLSLKEGGLFGWLLQLVMAGILKDAREIFLSSNAVIDRLLDYEPKLAESPE